jgi:hypothetical protein
MEKQEELEAVAEELELAYNSPLEEKNANKLQFFESENSDTLVVKIIGPGLQPSNCIEFPYGIQHLKSYGHALFLGHPYWGYDDIYGIQDIIAHHINKHNIQA